MGTRSLIGIMHGNNCKAIYCHWDGYLEHNGQILYTHYNSAKTNYLVSLGDLSSLGKEIGVEHPFSSVDGSLTFEKYNELYGDMCTFYTRDRKENAPFKTFTNYQDLVDHANNSWIEYIYIMRDGIWFVDKMDSEGLRLLSTELLKLVKLETA